MYKFLTKNGQALAFGLGVLITVIFLVTVLSGVGEFTALPEEEQDQTGIFNFGLGGAIALTIIAALALLAFGLFQIASDFKGSMKGIIGFGILLVIFFVSYSMASGEASPYIQGAINKFEEAGAVFTSNNLKFISGGISTAVALVVIAAIAFVFAEVRNLFK
ncbi:MAG: hypothetical protein J5I98_24430 [Phaeodactylibacter sp.]|nr:hypothetical protein [Phaeodactylibacter sp.]